MKLNLVILSAFPRVKYANTIETHRGTLHKRTEGHQGGGTTDENVIKCLNISVDTATVYIFKTLGGDRVGGSVSEAMCWLSGWMGGAKNNASP